MRAIHQKVKSWPSFNRRSHSSRRAGARACTNAERIVHMHIDRLVVGRSRVTRLARTSSKYKYVIRRNEGACVTGHLPRVRGPRLCPKEHRLKRRVLWDKEKVWRTGSCRSRWRRAPSVYHRSSKVSPRWNEDLRSVIACMTAAAPPIHTRGGVQGESTVSFLCLEFGPSILIIVRIVYLGFWYRE